MIEPQAFEQGKHDAGRFKGLVPGIPIVLLAPEATSETAGLMVVLEEQGLPAETGKVVAAEQTGCTAADNNDILLRHGYCPSFYKTAARQRPGRGNRAHL